MLSTIYFVFIIIFGEIGVSSGLHTGNLWCLGGGKKDFEPMQCEDETMECFKFLCEGIEEPFIARGCGLSVLTTAAGLPNESCHQAQSVCEMIGGKSHCFICNNKHLCNSSKFVGFLGFSIIFALICTVFR